MSVDTRSTSTQLFDVLGEVERLRAFVGELARLDDADNPPFGGRLMTRFDWADAARQELAR